MMISYKTIHAWISIVVALGLWTACGTDTPPDNTPPNTQEQDPPEEKTPPEDVADPNDDEPIVYKPGDRVVLKPLQPSDDQPVIPCHGSLCYDVTDPVIQERAQTYWEEKLGADTDELWDVGVYPDVLYTLQIMSEHFEACNYEQLTDDIIVSQCPEWANDVWSCPYRFFLPMVGAVASASDALRHYCIDGYSAFLGNTFSCPDGYVNTGRIGANWREKESLVPQCVEPVYCGKLADVEKVSGEDVCFYGDFTTVQTGVIPEQDCASLAQGTCAINCPCDNTGRVDVDKQSCQFLSEEHPIGLCGYSTCDSLSLDISCAGTGRTCAIIDWPSWAQDAKENGPMERALPGTCVYASACTQWSQQHPDLIRCGTAWPEVP